MALGAISNRSDRFDVIITASEEQDMDFVTFLSRIRTINDEIPIFVMLPEMDEQKASRAQISGANFFLDKPISDNDVKYLWQHVTRTRKMIAEDKAPRVTGERRGNKEMGSTLKIIDHDAQQNRRKFEWLMSNTSEHLVSDPKGKRKMVALGHELHFMDPIHMPRTREGKEVANEPNTPQSQLLNDLQQTPADQVHQQSDPIHSKVLNAGIIYGSRDQNISTGLEATVTGALGLMAWINQARETYRANKLENSPLSSRNLPESYNNATNGIFMTGSLEIGDWAVNPRLPPPFSEHGLQPIISCPVKTNLETLNFGAATVSSGDLNERYLLAKSPSQTIDAVPREGINMQICQAQWNITLMAELYPQHPQAGYDSSTVPANSQPYQQLPLSQLPTDLETYASSTMQRANIPSASDGLLQISGISLPRIPNSGSLNQEFTLVDPATDFNALSHMIPATASQTLNMEQQAINMEQQPITDVDIQGFQGLEDLCNLINNEQRRLNTNPTTENLEKFHVQPR